MESAAPTEVPIRKAGEIVEPELNHAPGLSRRAMLKVGTAGLFGMGLGLPQILAADRVKSPGTKDISLIFVFLHGGLSTIDTFDLKPDAPAEFRGEFNPIN